MRRRDFLVGSVCAATVPALTTARANEAKAGGKPLPPLVDTPPVLQVPAETSMGVAWGVTRLATGWVEVATKPDFSDTRIFQSGGFCFRALDPRVLSVRMDGLAPSTTYFYRTVTQAIDAPNAYTTKRVGEPVVSAVHTFTTLGLGTKSSFIVINDTHEQGWLFPKIAEKIAALKPAVNVWNGDACNQLKSVDHAVSILLNPAHTAFAADCPILFTSGNHDRRGIWARELTKVMMAREPQERDSRFAGLDRNFAVRVGEIAMIGLDTGEDKPDRHPVWAGLANYEPYRAAQTDWLADALKRPEIKDAPYLLAFCHIPLFDDAPDANPGDLLVDFASWQRPCSRMWSPLFQQAGVQAVIAAHQHAFRMDAPTPERPWVQIVGGGPGHQPGEFDTLIHGCVVSRHLQIVITDVKTGKLVGSYTLSPRK